MRKTLCIDFDNTLCLPDRSMSSKERNNQLDKIFGTPHPLAHTWLNEMILYHNILIFTARSITENFVKNLEAWLTQHDLPILRVTNVKPPEAVLFIDDRAWHFDGSRYPTPQEVSQFRSWNSTS